MVDEMQEWADTDSWTLLYKYQPTNVARIYEGRWRSPISFWRQAVINEVPCSPQSLHTYVGTVTKKKKITAISFSFINWPCDIRHQKQVHCSAQKQFSFLKKLSSSVSWWHNVPASDLRQITVMVSLVGYCLQTNGCLTSNPNLLMNIFISFNAAYQLKFK